MKIFKLSAVFCGLVALFMGLPLSLFAQRTCGIGILLQKLAKDDPQGFEQRMNIRQQLLGELTARSYSNAQAKLTSTQSPIPVVFHVILDSVRYRQIGGDTGIIHRVNSQLNAINHDYNRQNGDSSLIPTPFKPLYGSVGIQFGLTKTNSAFTISDGIELKIIPLGTPISYSIFDNFFTAKQATAIGLTAWDVTKYLNIWIVNMGNSTLGVTTRPSEINTTSPWGHKFDSSEIGVVLHYGVLGAREYPQQYFMDSIFDKGRSLTHEIGHFFELNHTWGDDNGKCPGDVDGFDDGIADTPPEADYASCNLSTFKCPTFPLLDKCSPNSPGVMFMNYMEYVDDRAMFMFTKGQIDAMRGNILPGGETYSLTQHPGLLGVGRNNIPAGDVFIAPNPATNNLTIHTVGSYHPLSIDIFDLMGQFVKHLDANGNQIINISVSDTPRGIYFLKCRFAEGTLTRKIVLQ